MQLLWNDVEEKWLQDCILDNIRSDSTAWKVFMFIMMHKASKRANIYRHRSILVKEQSSLNFWPAKLLYVLSLPSSQCSAFCFSYSPLLSPHCFLRFTGKTKHKGDILHSPIASPPVFILILECSENKLLFLYASWGSKMERANYAFSSVTLYIIYIY